MAYYTVDTATKIDDLTVEGLWANIPLCIAVICHLVCTRMRATEVIEPV